MQNKTYIISFDLDDTLYDNTPVIIHAFKELYEYMVDTYSGFERHFDFQGFVEYARLVHKANPHVFDFSLVRKMHIKSALDKAEFVHGDIDEAYEVFLDARQNVELFEETLPTLTSLQQDYQLISVSNGNALPDRIGLSGIFSASFNPTNCGHAKPDPNMYLTVCEKMNIKPSQLIHIGDCLRNDYHAAVKAGCHAIWFNRKKSTSDIQQQVSRLQQLTAVIPTLT